MSDVIRRALKLTTRSLVCAIRCKGERGVKKKTVLQCSATTTVRGEFDSYVSQDTLTRIRSWIRLDKPRLASTNRRVTGPGIPSV